VIKKELLERIYDSAYVQRWNDKFRPVELTELDKQAHKMTIAYLLGKFEEHKPGFNWIEIIEAGLFDFLQRLVLTDLKPQLLFTIRKKDPQKYHELNRWVFDKLGPIISPLGQDFCNRYKNYFFNPSPDNLNSRIVEAAHLYASKWEFDFIERANPTGYEIAEIGKSFREEVQDYYDLEGIKSLVLYEDYKNFVEFCGLLRFQFRWAYLYRLPRTSVLGHMLIVAMLSYLFSLEVHGCDRRCINNYFTGLFHDLPEVLTRDVINPIKLSIPGLDELIKDYEKEQMRKKVYPLVPRKWHKDIKLYTMEEFSNVVKVDGKTLHPEYGDICSKFNSDKYDPRDGDIVKASDILAAFLEAHLAVKSGIRSDKLSEAMRDLKTRLDNSVFSKEDFGQIHLHFIDD
jgi:putative hydrolase of HD superfamily